MLLNEVALGSVYDVYEPQPSWTHPPEGYDSVHGVRAQDGIESKFEVCDAWKHMAIPDIYILLKPWNFYREKWKFD